MKRIAIAAVAVLVAAGVAWAAYGLQQKRTWRAQVVQFVDAAGVRLGETLSADLNAPSSALADKLATLASEADADLERLRSAGTRPDRSLAEAADVYLGSATAVLKRQAGSARGRMKLAESRKALAEHLAKAAQRTEGWSAEAIRLKERLDADYFEYRIAVTSLGNMLGELPAAHLPEVAAIKDARARTQAGAEATRLEIEQAKQLVPR